MTDSTDELPGPDLVADGVANADLLDSAVDALAAIGDRRALPALEAVAQRDSRTVVREEALSAINRIK